MMAKVFAKKRVRGVILAVGWSELSATDETPCSPEIISDVTDDNCDVTLISRVRRYSPLRTALHFLSHFNPPFSFSFFVLSLTFIFIIEGGKQHACSLLT